MKSLKELKHKYSGQDIPEWELKEVTKEEPVLKETPRKVKLTKDVLKDGNFNPDMH